MTLIAIGNAGCRDTIVRSGLITIGNAAPDFNLATSSCSGYSVPMSYTGAGTPDSVRWNFGDGTFGNGISTSHTYSAPGTYSVTITVFNGSCVLTNTKTITILPSPQGDFSSSNTGGCQLPLAVPFTLTSAGSIASYAWNFGDGSTSTIASPSHTYTAFGSYDVAVVLTGNNGCSTRIFKPRYINIGQPQVTVPGIPINGCSSLSHTFSATINSTDPIVSYNWDFGGGNTSTAANPVRSYGPGVYPVSVTVQTASGCQASFSMNEGIKIGTPVSANFSGSPLVTCAENPVNFVNLSTGLNQTSTFFWDFGEGGSSTAQSPSYQYTDTGRFTVKLVVSNFGCIDSIVFPNYVHIGPPIAAFSKMYDCTNRSTWRFTDQSIGADSLIWDFGDGNTSNLLNPSHTYAAPGSYTVVLTVFNDSTGCKNTKTDTLLVLTAPPDFEVSDSIVCKMVPLTFTIGNYDTSEIRNIRWDFGDNTQDTGLVVTHSYQDVGVYDVSIIFQNVLGCIDTVTRPQFVTIRGPKVDFSAFDPHVCLGDSVKIIDSTIHVGSGFNNLWSIKYGDGSPFQSFPNVPGNYLYADTGSYNVTLAVQDNFGCTDTLTVDSLFYVHKPFASFTYDSLSCPGTNINLHSTSIGVGLTHLWEFTDGTNATGVSPVKIFNQNGNFGISLFVTDQYGCQDSLIDPDAIVLTTPVAEFSLSDSASTCPPLVVNFSNSSTDYQSIVWDFGNGNTSLVANPLHTYFTPGNYTVTMIAVGHGGVCKDTVTNEIIIGGPVGTIEYTPIEGCNPLQTTFTYHSLSNVESVIWDFGDGTVQTVADSISQYIYNLPGQYHPQAIFIDSAGCAVPVTIHDTIKVWGMNASFTTVDSVTCQQGNITFINNSNSIDTLAFSNWDFGDGSTSTLTNPVHFYAAPGIYPVTLEVISVKGCRDTLTIPQAVAVIPNPQIVSLVDSTACIPFNIDLAGQLQVPDTSILTWQWNFGNGTTYSGINPPNQLYNTPGTYQVTLIASNQTGCADTTSATFVVHGTPPVDAGPNKVICNGDSTTLQASGAISYQWLPSTSLSCTNCTTTMAAPSNNQWYYVTGTDINGCKQRDSVYVRVFRDFTLQAGPSDTLCVGQSATITASGTTHYSWTSSPAGFTATTPTIRVAPTQTTNYYVVATDSMNCFTHRDTIPIRVFPIPVINAGADTTVRIGFPAVLNATISPDVTRILWTPVAGIVTQTLNTVTVQPQFTTTYTATAVNGGGCTAKDQVTVFVICDGTNFFIPNTFTPNNDGMNDVFYPRGTGLFTVKNLKIYNRWGEIVFERNDFQANDPSMGWNGTYKGSPLPPDTYVYTIELVCNNDYHIVTKGNVTLLR